MNKHDIANAFVFSVGTTTIAEINELIADGWLRKTANRLFSPTEKLLDEAFLPQAITLGSSQLRYLSLSNWFYKKDLVNCLNNNEQIVKYLIRYGYLVLHADKRYRKSDKLIEWLTDGNNTFIFDEKQTQ
jgi:hypothetical protein